MHRSLSTHPHVEFGVNYADLFPSNYYYMPMLVLSYEEPHVYHFIFLSFRSFTWRHEQEFGLLPAFRLKLYLPTEDESFGFSPDDVGPDAMYFGSSEESDSCVPSGTYVFGPPFPEFVWSSCFDI